MNPSSDTLKYAPTHEWVRVETDAVVAVGISAFAQAQLGDVVFLQLPEPGRSVQAGEAVATVESVKTASDIHSPQSGKIIEVNTGLTEAPETVNEQPYAAWLFRLAASDADTELARLLDEAAYQDLTRD